MKTRLLILLFGISLISISCSNASDKIEDKSTEESVEEVGIEEEETPGETKRALRINEIPPAIAANVPNNYANSIVLDADEFTLPDGTKRYEIELEYNGQIVRAKFDELGNHQGLAE